MSTATIVITRTHTITYVTTKMVRTLKEVIRDIGLDPAKCADEWSSVEEAIRTWLTSRHLQKVILEIYDPVSDELAGRWELEVLYTTVGDGSLWTDTDAVRYAIRKAGVVPSSCHYQIKMKNADGHPRVDGWGPCEFRSTVGFNRYSLGVTVGGDGIVAETAYWSK